MTRATTPIPSPESTTSASPCPFTVAPVACGRGQFLEAVLLTTALPNEELEAAGDAAAALVLAHRRGRVAWPLAMGELARVVVLLQQVRPRQRVARIKGFQLRERTGWRVPVPALWAALLGQGEVAQLLGQRPRGNRAVAGPRGSSCAARSWPAGTTMG